MEIISTPDMLLEASFERFGGGEAKLHALTAAAVNETDINHIVEICNQPLVKKWVTFQYATGNDGEYTTEDAQNFIEKADQGWGSGSNFTYLVRDASEDIVGAIGIKSPPEQEPAEIGYWSDSKDQSRGYMTNAAKLVCELTRAAGYKRLVAYAMPDNEPSKKLLLNTKFKNMGLAIRPEDNRQMLMFTKELTGAHENNLDQAAG